MEQGENGGLSPYSVRVRVDVEGGAADEAAERDAGLFGELDRETRRCGDGGNDRDAGEQRLLYQLERGSARHQENRRIEGMMALEEHAAGDLVNRVVAADVLGG